MSADSVRADAELDVFCQNMLQSEDVSPLDLHLWDEQPPAAAPAPTSSDDLTQAPRPPNGHLGRLSSNYSTSSVANGSRLGSSESAAEPQNQQQMYAALFGELMPEQLVRFPPCCLPATARSHAPADICNNLTMCHAGV